MRFVAGPNGKVQLAKDGSIAVDCCVIEFHHDRKNRAAKFHKACEQMMKALLFTEMSKIAEIDAAAKEETKGDEGGEIVGGYMVGAPRSEREVGISEYLMCFGVRTSPFRALLMAKPLQRATW